VPDIHIASHGAMFWLELKTTKDNALNIRKAQIAWHMGYFGAGGVAFFLVARAKQGDLFLFHGRDALKLASNGLHDMEQSAVWIASCVLRVCIVKHEAILRVLPIGHERNEPSKKTQGTRWGCLGSDD